MKLTLNEVCSDILKIQKKFNNTKNPKDRYAYISTIISKLENTKSLKIIQESCRIAVISEVNKHDAKENIKELKELKEEGVFTSGIEGEGVFTSGIKGEGEYKEWHENGQLSMHCFFKNGIKEGKYKEWYENGQLYEHEFYKNGEEIEMPNNIKKDLTEYTIHINGSCNENRENNITI